MRAPTRRQALAFAGERGMAAARLHSIWALGVLELSLDRPAEVARLLAPERERLLAGGVGEPGTIRFVPDEIEALVALERADEARALIDWLEARGKALDRASALAAAARCRGLLAAASGDGEAAFAEFEAALAEHARVPNPFERARTLLALGATQRRTKKKAASPRDARRGARGLRGARRRPLGGEGAVGARQHRRTAAPSSAELTPRRSVSPRSSPRARRTERSPRRST